MAILLREEDVSCLLTMDDALAAVETAFRAIASNTAINAPRLRETLNTATMNVLCAISTETDLAGVKCYPIVRQGTSIGSSFTMLVYRISTGHLIGILEANKLGQMRTGAASGIATKYLARPDSRVMTLFGAGWQAQSQLEAIARVLPALERVNVIGRSKERVERFCRQMQDRLDLQCISALDAQNAVKEADLITTITASATPLFDGLWLQPGTHINAAGSNFANKQELDPISVKRADRIVVDDVATARIESGDLIAAQRDGFVDWTNIHSLSDLIVNRVGGRASADEITLFESHGTGLEDLAVAARVLELARQQNIGMEIPLI